MKSLIVLMLAALPAIAQSVEYTQCDIRIELDNGEKVPGYKQSYAVWMDGGLMQMLCN